MFRSRKFINNFIFSNDHQCDYTKTISRVRRREYRRIVTSTSVRWLFADIDVTRRDSLLNNTWIKLQKRTTQESEPKSKHQNPACVCQPENWTRTECERTKATDRKWTMPVVYNFQCDLCDASNVGYRRGHLHNRVNGHKQQSSTIAKHYKNVHATISQDLLKRFEVLRFEQRVQNAFYKNLKAKSQRAIRLYSCESIFIIFAPCYVNFRASSLQML